MDHTDTYARLFAAPVVETINSLTLPRYGPGDYIASTPQEDRLCVSSDEQAAGEPQIICSLGLVAAGSKPGRE